MEQVCKEYFREPRKENAKQQAKEKAKQDKAAKAKLRQEANAAWEKEKQEIRTLIRELQERIEELEREDARKEFKRHLLLKNKVMKRKNARTKENELPKSLMEELKPFQEVCVPFVIIPDVPCTVDIDSLLEMLNGATDKPKGPKEEMASCVGHGDEISPMCELLPEVERVNVPCCLEGDLKGFPCWGSREVSLERCAKTFLVHPLVDNVLCKVNRACVLTSKSIEWSEGCEQSMADINLVKSSIRLEQVTKVAIESSKVWHEVSMNMKVFVDTFNHVAAEYEELIYSHLMNIYNPKAWYIVMKISDIRELWKTAPLCGYLDTFINLSQTAELTDFLPSTTELCCLIFSHIVHVCNTMAWCYLLQDSWISEVWITTPRWGSTYEFLGTTQVKDIWTTSMMRATQDQLQGDMQEHKLWLWSRTKDNIIFPQDKPRSKIKRTTPKSKMKAPLITITQIGLESFVLGSMVQEHPP